LFYQKKYPESEETVVRLYREKSGQGDPFTRATRYAFLGENAQALDALDAAYASRSTMMPLLKTEPSLEPLHGEPRFRELVRKLALP
jgi:hypothetical protein